MTNFQPTFALLQPPSFDVLPDTDVRLGSIHPRTTTRPRRPDTKHFLNRSHVVDIPPDLHRTRTDPRVVLDSNMLRTGGAGITVHLPLLETIGGGVGGEASGQEVLYIDAQNVETQWFLPDDAYIAEALQNVTVKKTLLGFRSPSVFLVTGVKIAETATILTGHARSSNVDVGPEVDLTAYGVPVELAAEFHRKRELHRMVPMQKTRFVLAFETRRIRLRKKGPEEEEFNTFALLDQEDGEEQLDATSVRTLFDYDETTTEVADE